MDGKLWLFCWSDEWGSSASCILLLLFNPPFVPLEPSSFLPIFIPSPHSQNTQFATISLRVTIRRNSEGDSRGNICKLVHRLMGIIKLKLQYGIIDPFTFQPPPPTTPPHTTVLSLSKLILLYQRSLICAMRMVIVKWGRLVEEPKKRINQPQTINLCEF